MSSAEIIATICLGVAFTCIIGLIVTVIYTGWR